MSTIMALGAWLALSAVVDSPASLASSSDWLSTGDASPVVVGAVVS